MGWCTAQCKMLPFCAKTIVKESHNFEVARLKKKKKKEAFWSFRDFVVGTFTMIFHATGHVV